ncbi:myosin-10-like isoform X2 [Astyanax mexicanus]|uniref:Myosin-10-like isoform X2 n=1 Tax=Astyanax mexicanus TaxID=7994 RepID=A0A8T2KXA6_ASTMX|nr:myosin-10-like isoform X2 [Astyanax mexicanus]
MVCSDLNSFISIRWQENMHIQPNAAKSNQRRRRREPTHPTVLKPGLPKHTEPDRGHTANFTTTSTGSVIGTGMNTISSGGGGPSSSIRKTSISCIACSTENNSDVASGCSNSNSIRGGGAGVHSARSSVGISCSIKGSNGILSSGGGSGAVSTSMGPKGNSSSVIEGCSNNRRDTGCSTSSTTSLGSGLQEAEAEHNKRGGVLLESISNASSPCTSTVSSCLSSPLSQLPDLSSTNDLKAREGIESGYSSLEKTRSDAEEIQTSCDPHYRRSQVLEQFENQNGTLSQSNEGYSPSSSSSSSSTLERDHDQRASRSEAQVLDHGHETSGITRNSTSSTTRRSKSLERNLAEHTSAPDLLNFKKGWMTRLGEDGKWRKHWFVLTEQTLRFYRDSIAEEAADVDGEINLSTCFDITDFPVQRNYGFQIHTKDGVFTLCAMTYGIRRNWIQAVMKNVRPVVPPDVASSAPQKAPLNSAPGPKSHSSSNTSCSEVEKRSRISERRKEGRYKTFDWAEFRHRQQKREESNRQFQRGSEVACLPPAPASSPEEPGAMVLSEEPTERGMPYNQQRKLYLQTSQMIASTDTPTNSLSHTDASISVVSEQNGQKRIVDSVGGFGDISKMQVETIKKPEEETRLKATSGSSSSFPSSSVQTEWDWEEELQTLRSELKAEQERSEREVRELQLSEAHLQTELKNGQDHIQEMESRLQSAEATLQEKDEALEELRCHLEDVTGRLKATEEAQALKDVRIERHLRLLQESQERERRSLSDSLDHAEKRGKELEERLQQMEAELKNTPVGSAAQDLERRCQELQNQLEESDSEVARMQARLRNEETLYYNMEHDYEQVCEELECARGALQNCETMCEDRYRAQLEQQQREINRKEQELQEVLVKMAALGTSLEETERRLKEAQSHLQKVNVSRDRPTGGEELLGSSDFAQKVKNNRLNGTDMQAVAPREESERVISVIQALESKLCNTEERLREITMQLQRQQQVRAFNGESPRKRSKSTESLTSEVAFDNLDVNQCSQALQCLQGIMWERTAANTNGSAVTNGMIDFQDDFQEASESSERHLTLSMASRILSLETLVIQRMASAIERPSRELLRKLSELQVQAQAMAQNLAQDESHEKTVSGDYSQFLSCFQELDETSGFTLGQTEICNLCVRAELAYLTYTLHTRNSQEEQQGSDTFNLSPWPVPEVTPPGTRREMGSKPNFKLADIYPPELAPYSEQIPNTQEEEFSVGDMELECKGYESLATELRQQAQALQALSVQLQPEDGDVDLLPEFSPAIMQTILSRATLAYVTSRLRLALQQEMRILREQRERAMCECRAVCRSMEALFQEQTERYEEKLREGRMVIEMAELGRVSAETDAQIRGQEVQRLETEFEEKLQELQKIHEEEMTRLHGYYTQSRSQAMTPSDSSDVDENVCGSALKRRIRELENQVSCLEDELRSGDANSLRQAYEQELETLKATCELGFSSMEQSHQRVIEEMQRQHHIEVDRLTEEREKVLQEETNATIAAIDAMRKAHKEELEKSQKAQQSGANTDISKLRAQFDEELESLHRELEVLSEQYSQKCLENAHLSRKIETERQALSSTERENQELHIHNQELNKRLVAELSLMQSYMNGGVDHAQLPQGKDIYQLEVTLRVKESEIQCLRQEISSLKEELQAANRQSKELLKELSALGVKSQSDCTKRRADPYSLQGYTYDLMKTRSNPEFMRERSKRKQASRSKSLRDGLSAQERIKLFESEDNRKI